MSKARSLIGSILLFGGLAVAQPAIAQALGDANCSGGYYFELSDARIALTQAIQIVMHNALNLIGVVAPEKM